MSGGVATGNFTEPIYVSLQYPDSECAEGYAEQRPSAYGVSVLISVDKSRCKGKGLSKEAKIAIGVVAGFVGLLLLLLLIFFAVRLFAPTWAQKCVSLLLISARADLEPQEAPYAALGDTGGPILLWSQILIVPFKRLI